MKKARRAGERTKVADFFFATLRKAEDGEFFVDMRHIYDG